MQRPSDEVLHARINAVHAAVAEAAVFYGTAGDRVSWSTFNRRVEQRAADWEAWLLRDPEETRSC